MYVRWAREFQCHIIAVDVELTLFRMTLWSGKFFETLIGTRKEPLQELLTKLGVVYVMEPALTVLFVTNMVHVWENVMANLRSQVFRRILIQKVQSVVSTLVLNISHVFFYVTSTPAMFRVWERNVH